MLQRTSKNNNSILALCIHQKYYHNFYIHTFNKQRIEIHLSCRIFRNIKTNNKKFVTLETAKKGRIPIIDHQFIASIDVNHHYPLNRRYRLNKPQLQSQVYMSIKNTIFQNQRGYKISNIYLIAERGDTLKFADVNMNVIGLSVSFHGNNGNNIVEQSIEQNQDFRQNLQSFQFMNQDVRGTCKICYGEDVQNDDFLITPCECKGSCAVVHYKCLTRWLQPKVRIQKILINKNILKYSFNKFICQICKKQLPKCIVYKDQQRFLYMPQHIPQPYLILQQNNSLTWYIITFAQNQSISIGRTFKSQIIIKSEYISFMHAQIRYINGNFYLKDLISQNGTYVALRQSIYILHPIQLIIQGQVYYFQVDYRGQDYGRNMIKC